MNRVLTALVAVVSIALLAFCNAGAPPPKASPPANAPARVTSIDKILEAEKRGAIDADTRLLYTVFALRAPSRLPAEYRGDDRDLVHEATGAFVEARGRWDRLSPAVRAQIEPFYKPPTDPESFWAPATRRNAANAGPATKAKAAIDGWKYVDAKKDTIRFWYDAANEGALKPKAQMLAATIDGTQLLAIESRIVGGRELPTTDEREDGHLNVYLIEHGTTSVRGYEHGDVPGEIIPIGPCRGFVLLEALGAEDTSDAWLQFALSHEIFHIHQLCIRFPMTQLWAMEATAEWAADQVFPTLNFEWKTLSGNGSVWGKGTRAGPIGGGHLGKISLYANYLFFFYLTEYGGKDPAWVGKLLDKDDVLGELAREPDFREQIRRFALNNYTNDPVVGVVDHGAAIPTADLDHHVEFPDVILRDKKVVLSPRVPGVSVLYEKLVVKDDDGPVKKLTLDLSTLANDRNAGVQAIVTLVGNEGRSYVEDWTGRGKVEFCRERDAEKVGDIVFVVSNADPSSLSMLDKTQIVADASGKCDDDTAGSYTYQASLDYQASPTQLNTTGAVRESYTHRISSTWIVTFREKNDLAGELYYDIKSENAVKLEGSATEKTQSPIGSRTSTMRVSASGVSRNDASGADGNDTRGQLTVKMRPDGKADYAITWEMAHVPASHAYDLHESLSCEPDPGRESRDVTYDDGTQTLRWQTKSCHGQSTERRERATWKPYVCRPSVGRVNEVLSGTFDPKTELLTKEVSETLSTCGSGEIVGCALEQGSVQRASVPCTIRYSVKLRVKVPKAP